MKKYLVFLILFVFNSLVFGQSKILTGRIVDKFTFKPIQDVLVVNKQSSITTMTNEEGYFYIKVARTDTLVLYLIAYHPEYFYFQNDAEYQKQVQLILLRADIEQLKEVEILGKKNEEFKYPFNSVPASMMNPMSFLYERYSKKYQQYAKLKDIIDKKEREAHMQRLRNQRFTKELVMAITEIEPEEVEEFMQKSNFSKSFLETASDYDFMIEIMRKYKWWVEQR